MKKNVAILLCSVMLVCSLAGCSRDVDDPGPTLNFYLEKPTNFDPSVAYSDQAAAQFLPLIYQGLFNIDKNGKLQMAMCESYTVDGNVVEFRLKDTKWSDGMTVTATDYVYSWKRILQPKFQSEAASLLFYIQNAVEVKNGDLSIDDLRLYASGKSIIRAELIDASCVDSFLLNCASVALYPVQEDAVHKISLEETYYDDKLDSQGKPVLANNDVLTDYSWATLNSVMAASGPFYVKKVNFYPDTGNPSVVLERNKYYYRDTKETSDDALRKYVTPYQINVEFISSEDAYAALNSQTPLESNGLPISLDADIPLASRTTGDNVTDLMSTYTYFFNTKNPLFEKAEVRRALSLVLDRNEITNLVVYGKPATGLLTDGVYYTTSSKTTFRSKAGATLGSTMSVADAKAAISAAGAATSGSITLTIRDNAVEAAVADYVAAKWGEIGYNVTVEKLGTRSASYVEVVGVRNGAFDVQALYENLTRDLYQEKYDSGEYDVIGVQYSMRSNDPFSALSAFASRYSGNAYDFSESAENFDPVAHSTGYNSEAYAQLITDCLSAKNVDDRAAKLVEAEKLLMEDMPVAPLYYMQRGYRTSENLKSIRTRYDGILDYTKTDDSTYKYVPEAFILPTKVWG